MQYLEFMLSGLIRGRVRACLLRVTLSSLLLCIVMTGCAETRPGGYSCTGGCWTLLQLTHSHTDGTGEPDLDGARITGASSDIQVVPLSCDSSCRGSSGDPAHPGFIATELCLYQLDNKAWACIGYRTGEVGNEEYFAWYQVPGKTNTKVLLGAAKPAADSSGIYPYTTFAISSGISVSGGCGLVCISGGWEVDIFPSGASAISYALPFSLTDFQPTHIQYTQYIYGTSGATAGYTLFTNNQYGDKLVDFLVGTGSQRPNWHPIKHDGVLSPTGTSSSPSFAGWGFNPGADISGGMFYIYCCKHL
jgi:hypothetical protein